MKYYSKTPQELRNQFEEERKNESAKKKRAYVLQIANIGLLILVIFFAMKTPYFKKSIKDEAKPSSDMVQRSMKWKEWDITTTCTPRKHCSLNLVKKAASVSMDAFFWQIVEKDSRKHLMKSFELIPRGLEANQAKDFKFYIEKEYSEGIVELHFLDNRNEEIFMMQVYP